jgi:heme exporter protein D
VIAGGWGYVIAAYSITVLGLIGYAVSLKLRRRRTFRGGDE